MRKSTSSRQIWYPLKEYPLYEINKAGQIRNASSHKLRKIDHTNRSFARILLRTSDGRCISVHLDELVADTFLQNTDKNKCDTLIHLDGNPYNCSADNLTWSKDESAKQKSLLEKGIVKPDEYYTFYPLMEFPDSIYEINKMGQVRNKNTHKLLKGAKRTGYLVYTLLINGKIVSRSAHIMVAKQFIPNPENKPIVNHIDEDKSNPCIDNLEWVTASENATHGKTQERANIARNKPINEYNLQGEYIRTWRSSTLVVDYLRTLYPEMDINYASGLGACVRINSRKDTIKRSFCNRIFMFYEGNCENKTFNVSKHSSRKYTIAISDDLEVPNDYLMNPNELSADYIEVLKSLMTINKGLTYNQRAAIGYAIDCIKKIENIKEKKN